MQLKDFARRLPDDVWAEFEPVLPSVAWVGNGRPPVGNRECLHALLYVLALGVAWEMLPWCFPSYRPSKGGLRSGRSWTPFSPCGGWPSGTRPRTG